MDKRNYYYITEYENQMSTSFGIYRSFLAYTEVIKTYFEGFLSLR